jgi:hypothetical protein
MQSTVRYFSLLRVLLLVSKGIQRSSKGECNSTIIKYRTVSFEAGDALGMDVNDDDDPTVPLLPEVRQIRKATLYVRLNVTCASFVTSSSLTTVLLLCTMVFHKE